MRVAADLEEEARLDALAAKMVNEATSTHSFGHVLNASGFAKEYISIVHQQRRTTNLAWALARTKRIKPGDVIGVVGASFSGLMIATILALVSDAIVYVFEKGGDILPRFRDKAHRHISPVLNSRGLGLKFDPTTSSAEFRSPIFSWRAGRASDVAASWANEFENLSNKLPIFVFYNYSIDSANIHPRHDGVDIDLSTPDFSGPMLALSLLVDATGFGEENNPLGLIDHSYWESGHRLIYDHLQPPARVLISGCGDSGVVEALHYAIRDFQHSQIASLWPGVQGLADTIDQGLERARLDSILNSGEPQARYETEILSEIVWWKDAYWKMTTNNVPWPYSGEQYARPILDRLSELLMPLYRQWGGVNAFDEADSDRLEAFILSLPLAQQLNVREGTRELVDHWISLEMKKFADTLSLPDGFDELVKLARPDIEIVMNGLTPTAYSHQLSPYNLWVLRLLLAIPSVSYQSGKILNVNPIPNKRFQVQLSDRSTKIFDRVVTRYGPPANKLRPLTTGTVRNTQEDDVLLSYDLSMVDDAKDKTRRKLIDKPRQTVSDALEILEKRPTTADKVSKRLFVESLLLGQPEGVTGQPIYDHSPAWLARELALGRHPTYDADLALERYLTRR